MAKLAQDVDLSVVEGVLDDLAQDLAALTVHAHNALGEPEVIPVDFVPPSDWGERLGLLIWAFSLMRCEICSKVATSGARRCERHTTRARAIALPRA
jgi:hypothetical protein